MLPGGLVYINSWLEKEGDRCFQLMETDECRFVRRLDRQMEGFGEFRDHRDRREAAR